MDTIITLTPAKDHSSPALKAPQTQIILQNALQIPGVPYLLILIFLFLSSILTEFALGLEIKSFHLMVDGLHNILNVFALIFSIFSTALSKMPKNERFSFGYSRLEIIASFANCCFLLFLSLFHLFRGVHNALESLHEGGHSHGEGDSQRYDILIVFNGIRFFINIFGCIALRRFSSLSSGSNTQKLGRFERWYSLLNLKQYKKYEDIALSNDHAKHIGAHALNFHSVYTHLFIGLLINAVFLLLHCVEFFHGIFFELVFSVAILGYTIFKIQPIYSLGKDILMQALPGSHEKAIDRLLHEINDLEEVKNIKTANYWAMSPDHAVICLDLTIRTLQAKLQIETYVKDILKDYFAEIVIQTQCV